VRRRTSSTDVEETLPFSRMEFLLCASAFGGSPISRGQVARLTGVGWQTLIEAYPHICEACGPGSCGTCADWLTTYGGPDPSVRQRSGTGRWSGA